MQDDILLLTIVKLISTRLLNKLEIPSYYMLRRVYFGLIQPIECSQEITS